MPSWFDLRTLDATAPEDEEGILRATQLIHGLISDEIKVSVQLYLVITVGMLKLNQNRKANIFFFYKKTEHMMKNKKKDFLCNFYLATKRKYPKFY